MSKKEKQDLRSFWTPSMESEAKEALGAGFMTLHTDMIKVFGVARPGKTKRDRAKRGY